MVAALAGAREWDVGARCALAALICLVFTVWYVVTATYLVLHPGGATYLDRAVVQAIVPPLGLILTVAWFGVIAAGLWHRPQPGPARAIQGAVAVLFGVSTAAAAHLLGPFTTGVAAASLLSWIACGSLLLDTGAVWLGVGTVLSLIAVTTLGEQLGVLRYAPFLLHAPDLGGSLATSWIVGVGGITMALAVFLFLLVESLVGQWDERREALARTERALTAARSELTSTHAHLTAAYEDLRQAQARVLQGEKMASLGRLVAGAAHELNNPASFVQGGLANLEEYVAAFVQAIREYATMTAAAPGSPVDGDRTRRRRLDGLLQDAPDLLRICKEGAERIRTIVERLRGLARSEAGERTVVDVVAAIESALRFVDDRLRRRGIAVRRDYEAVPAVDADAAQLSQVWINLLTNAADALEGRPTPEIMIAVRHRAARIEVEIRDNGPGMDPETLRHILEPFFTTKPTGRGTGLGLSIAESTVKRHGGEIAFESDAGHGTRAIVRLPAASALPS